MSVMPASWIRSGRWGLYRDTREGWIAGVCAGIAERLGVRPLFVRLAFLALCFLDRSIPAVSLYVLLALLLERRGGLLPGRFPAAGYFADRLQAAAAAPAAGAGLAAVHARFQALDARLNRIEAAVTADDLSLRRKFRDLGG